MDPLFLARNARADVEPLIRAFHFDPRTQVTPFLVSRNGFIAIGGGKQLPHGQRDEERDKPALHVLFDIRTIIIATPPVRRELTLPWDRLVVRRAIDTQTDRRCPVCGGKFRSLRASWSACPRVNI